MLIIIRRLLFESAQMWFWTAWIVVLSRLKFLKRHPSPWNRQFFGVWRVELWVGDYCGFEGDCLLFFSRVPYYILINKRGLWTWKNSRNWGDGWRWWWNNDKYIYMSQLAQTPIRAGWNSLLSPFKAPFELAQIGMRRECHLMTEKCHPLFCE